MADLEQAKEDMEAALVNSFDTPRAMLVMLKLVNSTNAHLRDNKDFDLAHVEAIARWITRMVGIFGLDANVEAPYEGLGWTSATSVDVDPETAVRPYASVLDQVKADVARLGLPGNRLAALMAHDVGRKFRDTAAGGCRDVERLALPYLRAVSQIRDELRRVVSAQPAQAKKEILAVTDRIRDHDLSNLGVYLDDRPDSQPSLIKFIPAAELAAAREEKAAREAEKSRKKEARAARERAEHEARERAKVAPEDMFQGDERYGAWDGLGLPTKMKDGSDVPKSQLKSLKKLWERQKKAHEELKARGGL